MTTPQNREIRLTRSGYFAVLTLALTITATASLLILMHADRIADAPVILTLVLGSITPLVHYYLAPKGDRPHR